MWIVYLSFAVVIFIAVVVFSVRAIRAHRQVNDKMNELENELLQIRAKSNKKRNDPPEKSKSNQT